MKRFIACLILMAVMAAVNTGCDENGLSGSTRVRFQNNSATRTVCPIWDGMRAATLAPGQTSGYQDTTHGRHTLQWKDTGNNALTTIGWPDLIDGDSYTFPYSG